MSLVRPTNCRNGEEYAKDLRASSATFRKDSTARIILILGLFFVQTCLRIHGSNALIETRARRPLPEQMQSIYVNLFS